MSRKVTFHAAYHVHDGRKWPVCNTLLWQHQRQGYRDSPLLVTSQRAFSCFITPQYRCAKCSAILTRSPSHA